MTGSGAGERDKAGKGGGEDEPERVGAAQAIVPAHEKTETNEKIGARMKQAAREVGHENLRVEKKELFYSRLIIAQLRCFVNV